MTLPEPRPGGDGGEDGIPIPVAGASTTNGKSEATVGTGSVLGIGCVIAVIALVLVALAVRWLTGVW